jgi:hypothetical protein
MRPIRKVDVLLVVVVVVVGAAQALSDQYAFATRARESRDSEHHPDDA